VIDASRAYICIRPATFEDAAEAKYLEAMLKGRAGTLENTVFAMLSPDAKIYLVRPARSPQMFYRTPTEMAAAMKAMAAKYPPKGEPSAIPAMRDFRLALNTAAADSMPLVVAVGGGEATLAQLAWSPELLGKWAYAPVTTEKELKAVGIVAGSGIYAIEPDTYGQKGTILAKWALETDVKIIVKGLIEAQKRHNGQGKNMQQHINSGIQKGILWKSAVPNTDPQGPPKRY
jgi:hypothetical protein